MNSWYMRPGTGGNENESLRGSRKTQGRLKVRREERAAETGVRKIILEDLQTHVTSSRDQESRPRPYSNVERQGTVINSGKIH